MQLKLNRALCATTALATGLLLASSVMAQSTATQVQELVVTGARGAPNVAGAITQVLEAKDESIVNKAYFEHQAAGQNFGQLINMLPGVNYSSEDSGGNLSGDIRIHGFDGNHVSVTIDGSPVNDSGNYAVFAGEYLTAELTDHITVNLGSTSVDSPTASAVGGSVDIVSKVPSKTPLLIIQPTVGNFNFKRYFVEGDSGEIGPWGTRFYLAANYDNYSKWVGGGNEMKEGVDFRVYQPLKGTDFVSLAGSYTLQHSYFYQSSSPAQFDQPGIGIGKNNLDYNTLWVVPTARNGLVDTPPLGTGPGINKASTPGLEQGNDSFGGGVDGNYWATHPNPVIFAQLRGQSHFSLNDKLSFTFDPSFFYTLANGGGVFATSETDARLKGNTTRGVDLNGDGDTLDTVNLFGPNNTNTRRYLILASALYDLDEHNHFSLGYTLDYARHRQTAELGYIDALTGMPGSVFAGKDGWGSTKVYTADNNGSFLRGRDRFSLAKLNQFTFNYIGKFLDDRLHVNVGVRAPFFERDLNQHCYTYNGTSAQCNDVNPAAVLAAYNTSVAAKNTNALSTILFGRTGAISFNTATQLPNFRFPFSQTLKYSKVLPNLGVTYRVTDNQLLYATYSQGFSAPKTDNLYSSTPEAVRPETSSSVAAGWRYQTSMITTSFSAWGVDYKNRIVQSFDPSDPTLSIDRNIGDVKVYGLDLEAGLRPIDHLSIYASAELMKSDVRSNELVSAVGGVAFALPTIGKELVLTPDKTFAARVQYDIGDFTFGLQTKYSGKRFLSDVNDASLPDYTTVNFDVRWNVTMMGWTDTYLQLNVDNLTNSRYPVRISSVTNTQNIVLSPTATAFGKSYFYFYDSPRAIKLTLHKTFQ